MPKCACFHGYRLVSDGLGRPEDIEDEGDLLPRVLGSAGGCSVGMLSLLRDRIIIELTPELDECYALGPYKVVGPDGVRDAYYGDLLSKAKYRARREEERTIVEDIVDFAERHPVLCSVKAVTAPPRSDSSRENAPLAWAGAVADLLGASVRQTHWLVQPSGAQKNREGKVRGNIETDGSVSGDVLAIDDALESGGTMRELGRALRDAGARRVYGLCVAKTMEGIEYKSDGSYGIDLSAERWR